MKEEISNPDEMREYLEWKREKLGPKEGINLKAGDIVRVPRLSGDIDEGWKIDFIYPNDVDDSMMAKLTKEGVGEKNIPLSILEEVN